MELQPLTREDCQIVRVWRNSDMRPWRTPYPLTAEMQDDFYDNIVCNRDSNHRYFGIFRTNAEKSEGCHPITEPDFVGMIGLTYIQWENRIAEISLLINPAEQNKGLGEKAIDLIFDYGYNILNLKTIFGECYLSNPAIDFWKKIVEKYQAYSTILPSRKFWSGKYYDSLYFSIDKENFKEKDNG